MSKHTPRFYLSLVAFVGLVLTLAILIGCQIGNSSKSPPTTTGTVTTNISDPPTCGARSGQFKNVWMTITRVQANISSSAEPNDSGWVDLVNLTSSPKQIDLLSLSTTTCLLTKLGSTSGLAPGNYQQIRLYLLSNSPASGTAVPSPNQCGDSSGPFNCVVMASDGSVQALLLSSEAQTGIKIPPGQIAGGGINVQAGQSADLNIDFDACASIIQQGNGKFRLKPTLHAGEVSLNSNSISGRVVNAGTSPTTPIGGAVVLLEQPDPDNSNLDRVVRSAVTGSDGTFIFCPLPAGNYDVVAAATITSNLGVPTTFNATATLKVPVGTSMADIPLLPEAITAGPTSSPATLSGQVTTAAAGNSPAAADIALSALQSAGGGSPLLVSVPLFPNSTPNVTTESSPSGGGTCPTGTDCANYTLLVPASNPQVGTFGSGGTSYMPPAVPPVIYWVNALAFVPMSASSNPGSPDCSPSSLPATFDSSTQLNVTSGGTTTADFNFTGCQP